MWFSFRAIRAAMLVLFLVSTGCSEDAEPRAQLVVVVDTDVPLAGQLADHPDWSVDAAIDSVRIDVYSTTNQLIDWRDFIVPDVLDWPVSFGIAKTQAERAVRVRIRAFRGIRAGLEEIDGADALNPIREAAIHRLFEIELPESGVRRVRVVLAGDCYGRLPSVGDAPTTCVDAVQPSAPAAGAFEDIGDRAAPRTLAGSWPAARGRTCSAPEVTGRVCVPGGFTLVGDEKFAGFSHNGVETVPLHPVVLSPFWMDRTEFTVARIRSLVDAGRVPPPFPAGSPEAFGSELCNWSSAPGDRENHPVNCMSLETAIAACQAEGGSLPSEAQWEHAARGRLRRPYPWGSESPTCCAASLARYDPDEIAPCSEYPPHSAEVGTHLPSESCDVGDESRDGIVDLGGNVSELTRDRLVEYTEYCWGTPGVLVDPMCGEPPTAFFATRGGNFAAGLMRAAVAFRSAFTPSSLDGFRCVYEDVP